MTSSSYQDWTHEVLNTHLRISSIIPTRTVDRYTRAGRYGKTIVAQSVTKLPQYITLVGQHLVVKSVVLWLSLIHI